MTGLLLSVWFPVFCSIVFHIFGFCMLGQVPAANLSCSRGIRCESDVTNAYGSFSYRIFVLGNVRQYSDGPRPDYIFTPIFKTLLHGLRRVGMKSWNMLELMSAKPWVLARSRGKECGYMTGFVDKARGFMLFRF